MKNTVEKYFPDLTARQREQFAMLGALYAEWNARINVISHKDMDHFYERHVLHSLAIAKVCRFPAGSRVLDVGTGGGFPGIPLSIMFPESRFVLADSIGKKIKIVEAVSRELGLENVEPLNARAENIGRKFDYVVSRAVTDMVSFTGWIWDKIVPGKNPGGSCGNGILYLKGGDISVEMEPFGGNYSTFDISGFFGEEFFETKKVVYIPKRR